MQVVLNVPCDRVRATEHAPRNASNVLERRQGLAEIVERGAGVVVERLRIIPPQALNYASSLLNLARFEEAKTLLRKMTPVARRVLDDDAEIALRMRAYYASSLYEDPGATLDDLREAVTMLEDTERTARRVFGGAHPLTKAIGNNLRIARAKLRARQE